MQNNKSFNLLSDEIDLVWSGQSGSEENRFNTYYDYYFSGEDVKVFIDGLYDPSDELDIASFAYSVRQEKQPLYGFWSYNYDTVMLGTRIITGEITLFTRYPQRMTDLLAKAAEVRVNSESRGQYDKVLTRMSPQNTTPQDEANLQKYWSYSQLDRVTSDPASEGIDGRNIFSAHPPFNFVVMYGAEETALTPSGLLRNNDQDVSDALDRLMYSDVNERSVKVNQAQDPMKIVLQQVHLMNMSTAYTPGGQPVAESYQFIARDYYFSKIDLSFVKNIRANVVSDDYPEPSSGTASVNTQTNYQ
jgi:hypothetical protein